MQPKTSLACIALLIMAALCGCRSNTVDSVGPATVVAAQQATLTTAPLSTDSPARQTTPQEKATAAAPERTYWPTNGWKTSTPEDQGMDSASLETVDTYIRANMPQAHSLLVARGGYLVFEQYYNGYTADQLNNTKCVTKSIMDALAAIAVEKGFIHSLDQRVEEFYPQYFGEGNDPQKKEIRIRHLLELTAGLDWRENQDHRTWNWIISSDRFQYTLQQDLVAEPGAIFNYNTGLTHLLSGIIAQTSGMSTLDFAKENLFGPLGITNVTWETDQNGIHCGGCDIYMTPRDMTKFGYLYLNRGNWETASLVPETWVAESTKLQHATGIPLGEYGRLWWIKPLGGHEMYYAAGWGGQRIFVIPSLDMVIVYTAEWETNIGPDLPFGQLVEIIKAVQ